MEKVKEKHTFLEMSDEFKNWKKIHSHAYLTHAFCMCESGKEISEWQFGYYHKDRDKMTTFILEDDVSIMPESEILKKDDLLNLLDMSKVKIDLNPALDIAKKTQEENYKGQLPMKIIVLLQNLSEGLVWNITYLTIGFKTLNIKISAIDGKVVDHSLKSLISQM